MESQREKRIQALSIVMKAVEVFHSNEKADQWLNEPNPLLDGYPPIALLRTEEGRQQLDKVLDNFSGGLEKIA